MISYIQGKLLQKDAGGVTVLTPGGVGYYVVLTKQRLATLVSGNDCSFHIYMKISDSAMDLYGFQDPEERGFFSKLISVKSVGPKSAMHILSLGSMTEIQSAIQRGDVAYLTAVQGLGKKTAERIVVELKGKLATATLESPEVDGDSLSDVVDALVAMGYTKEEARETVKALDAEGKSTDELIRLALQMNMK